MTRPVIRIINGQRVICGSHGEVLHQGAKATIIPPDIQEKLEKRAEKEEIHREKEEVKQEQTTRESIFAEIDKISQKLKAGSIAHKVSSAKRKTDKETNLLKKKLKKSKVKVVSEDDSDISSDDE